MADLIYNRGLDELRDWQTASYKALLLKGSGYTPNKDHDYVANLTPASNETALAGYARVTLSGMVRTVDDTLDRVTYDCADLAFGSIAVGDTISAMVVYLFVTNDADSILVGYHDLVDTATDGAPFTYQVNAAGLYYIDNS